MRLATLLAKARRWRDRAVSRDDEQNTGSKNLLLLFHVKRIIVRRNIEISRLSRAWFIVVFAKRPVPVFRAVEKRDRMPASASADFFDVSSRSPQKRTQKNARQKRTYKKKRGSRSPTALGAFRRRSFGTRRAQNPRERPPRRPRRPLSILSSACSPPKRRRDTTPARARVCCHRRKKKGRHLPGRYERVFSIDAPAVRSGRRRVRVVVEIEALFARRGQTGHSLWYSFFLESRL